jgi:hypothetical protein
VRARKGATRKGAGGTGSRVPHSRKGAGPGHSRVPVRARKGALVSGALAQVPVRARTHRSDLTCASGSSNRLTVWFKFKRQSFFWVHCVELLLHLAEHGLMKLVPIYMF